MVHHMRVAQAILSTRLPWNAGFVEHPVRDQACLDRS